MGTNWGFFLIFLKDLLPYEFTVDTFSYYEKSEYCVNRLNEYYGDFVNFISGNTKETFTKYQGDADFIWIDGGHEYDVTTSDLNNAARLGIVNICLDDINHVDVNNAVYDFLKREINVYKIHSVYNDNLFREWRGIIYLKKM